MKNLEKMHLCSRGCFACYRRFRTVSHSSRQIGYGKPPFIPITVLKGSHFSCRAICTKAHMIRVGFVQGNFNSDNTLIGGRTMDYGPFGTFKVALIPSMTDYVGVRD